MATISILQEGAIRESAVVNEQLQRALNSRVLIEQAKGVISQLNNVDMNEAFALLRSYARGHNQALNETAGKVISRSITL